MAIATNKRAPRSRAWILVIAFLLGFLGAAGGFIVFVAFFSGDGTGLIPIQPAFSIIKETPATNPASAPSFVESLDESDARELQAEAEPGGIIEIYGSVILPSGERGGGFEVLARALPRRDDIVSSFDRKAAEPVAKTVTSADGSFILKNVPRRPTLILARGGDAAPAICMIQRRELLGRPARVGPLTLQLSAGFAVRGKVLQQNGEPARGAVVLYELERRTALSESEWCDYGFSIDAGAVAGADGTFIFTNVPKPRRELYMSARGSDGFASAVVAADPWPPAPVELKLILPSGRGGVVLDEESRPVAGARIAFGRSRAASGAEGAFHLQLDPRDASTPGKLMIAAPGFVTYSEDLDPRAQPPIPWRIQLGRGSSVSGKVINDRGEPVEGAIITFEGRALLPGNSNIADLALATANARLHAWETTILRSQADGSFRAQALPHPNVILSVRYPSMPTASIADLITTPAENLILQLPAPPAGFGSIEGKVVDRATRRAIINYKLFAITKWGSVEAITNMDGEFRLDRCPAGPMTLRISPRGAEPFAPVERIFTLAPDEEKRELLLEVGGEGLVKIAARAPRGSDAKDAELVLLPIEGDALADATPLPAKMLQNIFQWEKVSPGLYAVAASKGSLAIEGAPRVRVSAGETVELKVNLTNGAMLMIAVRPREESATLAPYGLRVRDAAGTIIYDQRPGPTRPLSGAGAQLTIPLGKYIVSVDRNDQTLSEKRVELLDNDGAVAIFEVEAETPK